MQRFLSAASALVIAAGTSFGQTVDADSGADLRLMLEQQARQLQEQREMLALQQAKIDRLMAERNGGLTERRAEEVKQLIREVVADADFRASFLEDGLTAGHNGKTFFIKSQDGQFALNIAGQVQVRYVFSGQDGSATDDEVGGFEIARTRFGFIGHVVDPTWKYVIWTGHADTGSELLLDTYITKVLGDGWSVTAGQFKVPMWREWLVSEKSQQLIERSLLNALSGSYTQGVVACPGKLDPA